MKIEIEKPVIPKWFDEWYKTFNGDKIKALRFLNRTGWGYDLTYDNGCKVENYSGKLHNLSDDGYCYGDAQEYLSKAILHGYDIEQEPLYYAKIKGWEILGKRSHWIYLKNLKEFTIGTSSASHMEIDVMTNEEWNRLGINETNADFEEAE